MTLTAASPTVLWLALPAIAVLFLFRLFRSKRKRVHAGSLLIWNRLAALPVSAPPKRVVFDLSLLLQTCAVLALVAALAGPSLAPQNSRAQTILFALDNGTLARARDSHGTPQFGAILDKSKALIQRLDSSAQIYLARTAPLPAVLNATPLNPAQALDQIGQITPALSGPDSASIWLFATDRARALAPGAAAQAAIVSLQAEPAEARRVNAAGGANSAALWLRTAAAEQRIDNVAIVEAGSASVDSKQNGGPRVLIRLANHANQSAAGSVLLEAFDSAPSNPLEQKQIAIDANGTAVVSFRIPRENKSALRISWRNAANIPDALPEDDSVVLAPRPEHAPRIRFHSPQPALEELFRVALNAEIAAPDENGGTAAAADLDVYNGSVPERLPENSRAALFVAPERGFRSYFDVGEKTFVWPAVQRGEDNPLNAGIASSENSGILISKAFEILRTGDFATLLRDAATGRALAARFLDEKARPCYVLAFSPGDGFPAERQLDPPLAALLVRMTLEAARAGPPYARIKAADLETALNLPLPLNWRPGLTGDPAIGTGVLDERASDLHIDAGSPTPDSEITAFLSATGNSATAPYDLAPWLIVLGLLLASAEFLIEKTV